MISYVSFFSFGHRKVVTAADDGNMVDGGWVEGRGGRQYKKTFIFLYNSYCNESLDFHIYIQSVKDLSGNKQEKV